MQVHGIRSLKKFSKVFKGKYAIAMNSGTATLHSALEALGVSAGDEVISPALAKNYGHNCNITR